MHSYPYEYTRVCKLCRIPAIRPIRRRCVDRIFPSCDEFKIQVSIQFQSGKGDINQYFLYTHRCAAVRHEREHNSNFEEIGSKNHNYSRKRGTRYKPGKEGYRVSVLLSDFAIADPLFRIFQSKADIEPILMAIAIFNELFQVLTNFIHVAIARDFLMYLLLCMPLSSVRRNTKLSSHY